MTTGTFGEDKSTTRESRIYQETLFPVKVDQRFYMNHRVRYEQRFVDNQDFRTRYRYNLFLNVALNSKEMKKKTVYLALYNEILIMVKTTSETDKQFKFSTATGSIWLLGITVLTTLKFNLV